MAANWEIIAKRFQNEVETIYEHKTFLEREITQCKNLYDDEAKEKINAGDYDAAQENILQSKYLMHCLDMLSECFPSIEAKSNEQNATDDYVETTPPIESDIKQITEKNNGPVNAEVPLPEIGDIRFARPYKMTFDDKEYKVEKWSDVYLTICSILRLKYMDIFEEKVLSQELQGKSILHYSKDKNDFVRPGNIKGTDIYMELNRNAFNTAKVSSRLIEAFGENPRDCLIYVANYNVD